MLHYHLYKHNIDFNLLSGVVGKDHHGHFDDQIQRARSILKNRTPDEIDYALSSLDWMLQQGSNRLLEDTLKNGHPLDHKHILNRVKSLKALMNDFDISDQSQLQDATWSEYFATLTLALVAEMLCQEQSDKTRNMPPQMKAFFNALDGGQRAFSSTPWAIQTMEAVCYAEQLDSESKLANAAADAVRNEMRARSEKGNKVKSAKYNELYKKIIEAYEKSHTTRSNRDAAKRIYAELKPDVDNTLRTDDPEKQIEKVIGLHVNGKLKL